MMKSLYFLDQVLCKNLIEDGLKIICQKKMLNIIIVLTIGMEYQLLDQNPENYSQELFEKMFLIIH